MTVWRTWGTLHLSFTYRHINILPCLWEGDLHFHAFPSYLLTIHACHTCRELFPLGTGGIVPPMRKIGNLDKGRWRMPAMPPLTACCLYASSCIPKSDYFWRWACDGAYGGGTVSKTKTGALRLHVFLSLNWLALQEELGTCMHIYT